MNKEQGTRNKVLYFTILILAILSTSYALVLTVHYRIPDKIFARLIGKQIVDPTWSNMYEGMVAISEKSIKHPDIIMLGDSITYGLQWNDHFSSTIFNRGIGGDRTNGVLNRLDDIIKSKPQKVFIMIGINDISAGIKTEEIIENTKSIIMKLRSNSITPFVQSVLYVTREYKHPKFTTKRINDSVDIINKAITQYCLENGIQYLDINSLLDDDHYLNMEYSYDNIHLNNRGYEIWINELRNYIN